MLIGYKRSQTSVVLRVLILDSSVSTGAGKTGLTSSSTGLIISTIADNEASATAYAVGSTNVESITTLGTFAAPTSGKCRFKEVDSTNHPGIYEIQIADARFGVASAKSLLVSITGASNAAPTHVCIPLRDLDPYDSVRGGLTALPNASAAASGGLLVLGTGTGGINASGGKVPATLAASDVTGNVAADLQTIKTQAVTCGGGVTIPAATLASTTNITGGTITTVSGNVTGSVGSISGVTFPTNFGSALISVGGKITATLAAADVSGNIAADVQTIKGQTVTCAGGVTIPAATLASTTNITAGTITTVSGNVTGNVGGNVTGSVGSISGVTFPTNFSALAITLGGAVTAGTVSDKTGYSLSQSFPTNFASLAITAGGAVTAGTVSDKTGYALATTPPTASEIVTATLAGAVEGSETLAQTLRLVRSACVGIVSGAATSTIVFRDAANTKARITATTDGSGNRTAVTTDAT